MVFGSLMIECRHDKTNRHQYKDEPAYQTKSQACDTFTVNTS